MERQFVSAATDQTLHERPLDQVDGDAASPEFQASLRLPALRQGGRQVGILDHTRAAVHGDDHAQSLVRGELLDDFERHLGIRPAVMAEENGVGDVDERVIDLEVEEGAHPALAHLVETTRRTVGTRLGQGGERSSVAVGTEGDGPFPGEQKLARRAVHGGHLALPEETDVR